MKKSNCHSVYSYVRSNFPPQKHLTGNSKRNFCDDFQTPPSIEWMVMFYFQFKNFVLTWLWSSPSFQRRPACEIFINCKTVFGGYFDQKNSFFPNKKSSAINRNVCIQLFYNDNDNTWWRWPRQTSFPWYIRLHILSLQSNMLHLIEIFIFSHKAPVYFQSWIWRLEKRGDASVLFLCL